MEKSDSEPEGGVEPTVKEESQSNGTEGTPFFHPMPLSEEDKEFSDEKEIEDSAARIEQKLREVLKSISEETLQLREFLTVEDRLLNEVCTSLQQILKRLRVSFRISPHKIPGKKNAEKVILNSECNLLSVDERGETESVFLAECPPETVMSVLWIVMPKLGKVVVQYRKKITVRVRFFEKVKKELRSVAKAIVGRKELSKAGEHKN